MNLPKPSTESSLYTTRVNYDRHVLLDSQCPDEPHDLFEQWLSDAMLADPHHANAVTLCTVGNDMMPDARTVLMREARDGRITFFTNYKSNKAMEIDQNPHACLLFFWRDLERQVKIQGKLTRLPESESDKYFASRPFESKVASWASVQSQPVKDRETLDNIFALELQKFTEDAVPRPPHWGGYAMEPTVIEFWQGRGARLHDRIRYQRESMNTWSHTRLMP